MKNVGINLKCTYQDPFADIPSTLYTSTSDRQWQHKGHQMPASVSRYPKVTSEAKPCVPVPGTHPMPERSDVMATVGYSCGFCNCHEIKSPFNLDRYSIIMVIHPKPHVSKVNMQGVRAAG